MSEKWITGGKTEALDKYYKLGKAIGQPGQFGEAYRITDKKTGELRAVKVISKNKFRDENDKAFHYGQLRQEIKIMHSLSHANIIKMFEVFESSGHLYIVMQCCNGGELFDRIQNQPNGSFSEQDAQGVLRQIIEGIKYLHSKDIAHCDLKPDNFLFENEEKKSPLKIIDFGMSKHVSVKKNMSSFRGTPYYVAPEVLSEKYNASCDIWSFGVVMFVMLFGYPPFHANSDEGIFQKIKAGFTSETKKGYGAYFPSAIPCSADAKDLITKCLNRDSAARVSAAECLEHKFFTTDRSSEPMTVMLAKLKDFRTECQFKSRVLDVMSDAFASSGDKKELAEQFRKMDNNGDGEISKEEMVRFLEGKVSKEDAEKLFEAADFNGDGTLEYKELMMAMTNRKIAMKEERLWAAFCKFDTDMDGSVELSELMAVLKISEEEAKKMVAEVDTDGNGKVEYEEFKAMWMTREE